MNRDLDFIERVVVGWVFVSLVLCLCFGVFELVSMLVY